MSLITYIALRRYSTVSSNQSRNETSLIQWILLNIESILSSTPISAGQAFPQKYKRSCHSIDFIPIGMTDQDVVIQGNTNNLLAARYHD